MDKSIPFISSSIIFDLLPNQYGEVAKDGRLTELSDSSTDSRARKRFYRLSIEGLPDLHLTYGHGLSPTYERSKDFHSCLPKLTCRPVFLSEGSEYDLFGQEFFEGKPIDQCLVSGDMSELEINAVLAQLSEALGSLATKSTEEAKRSELEEFGESILENQFFGETDRHIIKNTLLPWLLEKSSLLSPEIRWSPGDLAARNIILGTNGEFRIIDFEFARQTHFHQEDWIRLERYSLPAFSNLSFFTNQDAEVVDFMMPYFWLRQAFLDSQVHQGKRCRAFLKVDLSNACLSAKLDGFSGEGNSLILSGLSNQLQRIERKHFMEFHGRLRNEQLNALTESKLHRVQQSASWKMTGPLRFLRRKLIDPHKAENTRGEDACRHEKLKKGYGPTKLYHKWISKYDRFRSREYKAVVKQLFALESKPLISILLPVFDPDEKHLHSTIESVFSQIYPNWELCIVNDASKQSYVRPFLDSLCERDKRVKVSHRLENGHISLASNEASTMAEGDFVLLLDHDDLLRPHSVLRFAEKISSNPSLKLIYSDEDKVDEEGVRFDHYFKPDWNPDLFLSQNYICHLTCISRHEFVRAGGFRIGIEGSQDWDLFLRICEGIKDEEIGHIPEILYHWRATEKSTASTLETKSYALKSSLRVINDALERRSEKASAEISDMKNGYLRVKYSMPDDPPLVSVLIPTRNRFGLISRCIESLLDLTSYGNYEIIILDHESDAPEVIEYFERLATLPMIRILKVSGEFNYSKINNFGVKQAKGSVLLLLNNDIEVIHSDWMDEMVSQALRPEIGCVGAKLLYPNDLVQHGGVIIGLGGVAGHSHKLFHAEHPGYKHRLQLVQNLSAVTAACLAVRKESFTSAGGFNEEHLKVAFNDVDFCLKVEDLGLRNLWSPYAVLKHHESASRGKDSDPDKIERFRREVRYMKDFWGKRLVSDPHYNPNLTNKREDFSLAIR